jgi:hypothetical protein
MEHGTIYAEIYYLKFRENLRVSGWSLPKSVPGHFSDDSPVKRLTDWHLSRSVSPPETILKPTNGVRSAASMEEGWTMHYSVVRTMIFTVNFEVS